jgi:hypothetical protein
MGREACNKNQKNYLIEENGNYSKYKFLCPLFFNGENECNI